MCASVLRSNFMGASGSSASSGCRFRLVCLFRPLRRARLRAVCRVRLVHLARPVRSAGLVCWCCSFHLLRPVHLASPVLGGVSRETGEGPNFVGEPLKQARDRVVAHAHTVEAAPLHQSLSGGLSCISVVQGMHWRKETTNPPEHFSNPRFDVNRICDFFRTRTVCNNFACSLRGGVWPRTPGGFGRPSSIYYKHIFS